MPIDVPHQPPVLAVAASPSPSFCGVITQAMADSALASVQGRIPGTKFLSAHPSKVPGLVMLQLKGGKVAYTDPLGKFLVFGLIFDIDTGKALDHQMDGVSNNSK